MLLFKLWNSWTWIKTQVYISKTHIMNQKPNGNANWSQRTTARSMYGSSADFLDQPSEPKDNPDNLRICWKVNVTMLDCEKRKYWSGILMQILDRSPSALPREKYSSVFTLHYVINYFKISNVWTKIYYSSFLVL